MSPAPTTERQPRCPYCRVRPCQIYMKLASFNGAVAVIFACGKCDKIISVAPVPTDGREQNMERRHGGLVLPTM